MRQTEYYGQLYVIGIYFNCSFDQSKLFNLSKYASFNAIFLKMVNFIVISMENYDFNQLHSFHYILMFRVRAIRIRFSLDSLLFMHLIESKSAVMLFIA